MSEGQVETIVADGARKGNPPASLYHGLVQRLIWVLFLIAFFQSGLVTTTWLLEPENFEGGLDWLWLGLFPLLLPLFFVMNRRFGCAAGACSVNTRDCGSRPPPGH